MSGSGGPALAITEDGTSSSRLQAVVTPRDLSPVFGDQPVEILRAIRDAASTDVLRALNQRARAFALQQLTSTTSVGWVSRFLHLVDSALLRRLVVWSGGLDGASWCLYGAAGRVELLTRTAPGVVLVLPDGADTQRGADVFREVAGLIGQCGYLESADSVPDALFRVATRREWQSRYAR